MIKINSDKIDQNTFMQELEYVEKTKKQNIPDVYQMQDFLKYDGTEFVQHAYKIIIGSEINPSNLKTYLGYLKSGYFSKTDIICKLLFSEKGSIKGIKILGIKKRQIISQLSHIPKIGYFFKFIFSMLSLPKLVFRLNILEEKLNTQIAQNAEQSKLLNHKLATNSNNIIQTQKTIKKSTNSLNEINLSLKTLKNTGIPSDVNGDTIITNLIDDNSSLDPFYIEFEETFRGEKEDIKNRFKYYLPFVKEVMEDSDVILDIGCGRGEWLELLKENQMQAKGIDLNISMVKEAEQQGLEVSHIDAITYLKSVKQKSIKVITGFHIVEHMEFDQLLALFDYSFRALKQGGIIIFETPNPENILVGSCSFYTDPTHKNPIPPSALQFIANNRGFSDVHIHRLHPLKEMHYNGDDKSLQTLFSFFSKEQDYSIIGVK